MIPRNGFFLLLTLFIYRLEDTIAQTGNNKTDERIRDIFGTVDRSNPVTSNPESCECVDYYLCNGTHINTNGEGIIDIRANENQCDSYLQFCCIVAQIVPDVIKPIIQEKHPTGCGWRNPDGVGFRIEGDINNEAKFGEFPWMVAVLREEHMSDNVLSVYQCGGSLIHPSAVITAAHCVANKEKTFIVRAGEWDTQTTRELLRHQNRKVQSVILHPRYYAGALFNDVALLILESPFELDEHIDVACLPEQGAIMPSGERCWASGWGKDLFGAKGKYQVIMKKIDLPLVNRDKCQDSLRTTRLGKHFQLHDSFVCAGGEQGKDTCQGDGGSPLVCPIPGQSERYQHVGIVAWGIGCGENNVPGVYANMGSFRSWIDAEMAKNNLDTSGYKY